MKELRHAPYVLLIYATRVLAAFVMASGVASVATRAVGAWPSGDQVLFEPGGLMLMEVLRLHRETLMTHLTQAGLVTLAMIPIGLVTSTLLLVSLCDSEPKSIAAVVSKCGEHLTPMLLVYLVMTTFAGAIVWFVYIFDELLSTKLVDWFGVRIGDIAYWTVMAVGVLLGLLVTIVHDLVRVSVVKWRMDTLSAIARGWRVGQRHWGEVLIAFWPRAAGIAALVLGALVLAKHLGLASTVAIVGQQIAVLGWIVLRASWLARAASIGPPPPAPLSMVEAED